jgi:hypothetical protein
MNAETRVSTRWRSEPRSNPSCNPRSNPSSRARWQIESGTRGVCVGITYAERTADWQKFTWSPDPARIIRFYESRK